MTSALPPVLLVHGWAGSFDRTWVRSGLVDILQDANRHAIPYDLPGHGSAGKSHDPSDYADMASHLLAAVELVGPPVDAVGFSLGAITLLRAAVRSPQSFGRIVLAGIGDGVFHPHDPARAERIISGLEGRAEPGDVTARFFGKIGNEPQNDPLALAAVLRRPRDEAFDRQELSAVSNRILVAIGDKDFSGPADVLVSAFPNAHLVTLRGVDHFRTPEALTFVDSVLEFLGAP